MSEAQLPGQLPDFIQAALGRAGIGRQDQGRPLEQLRKGVAISGALDSRHGVAAHEMETCVSDHALQGSADYALYTAAVHDRTTPAELIPVPGDIVHGGLGVQRHDHQLAIRQPVCRQGGGDDALVQSAAENRSIGVIAQEGAVRILMDGLGHAAADQAQSGDAYRVDHHMLLPVSSESARPGEGAPPSAGSGCD